MRKVWMLVLCMGCPPAPDDKDDTGNGDDDDAVTLDASGEWSGSCSYISDGYTSVDRVDVDLSLTDDAGVVTGTMTFVSYYTGTTSSYGGQYGLEGTRTDDQVELDLVATTTTTTTSTSSASLVLTLDGDAMVGTFDQYGTPQLDCEFAR